MKIKSVLGVLCCLIATAIAFADINITGNVIGYSVIDGIKGIVVVIFLLGGLALIMTESIDGVSAEALRNSRQGVPNGEYHADIGIFKKRGGVTVPRGTFHADIGKNLLGENKYTTYRNKTGKLMRVYIRAYEGPEVSKAIGKDREEHTDFRRGVESVGPPDFHVHVITSYDETPHALAADYSVSAATLRPMNGAILPGEIKNILEKIDRNVLYERAKKVFYDQHANKEEWYSEDRGPVKK